LVVGGSKVVLNVFPDVLEISEVKIQVERVLLGEYFILDGVSVITKEEFLIIRVDILNKGEIKCFFCGLEKCFVIRFKIHML